MHQTLRKFGMTKDLLRRLLDAHGNFAEIARAHNLSHNAIKVFAHYHGVKNSNAVYERNIDGLELGRVQGIKKPREYVESTKETRWNLKVTDTEILEVAAKHPNLAKAVWARKLGITRSALALRIKRLVAKGKLDI